MVGGLARSQIFGNGTNKAKSLEAKERNELDVDRTLVLLNSLRSSNKETKSKEEQRERNNLG